MFFFNAIILKKVVKQTRKKGKIKLVTKLINESLIKCI